MVLPTSRSPQSVSSVSPILDTIKVARSPLADSSSTTPPPVPKPRNTIIKGGRPCVVLDVSEEELESVTVADHEFIIISSDDEDYIRNEPYIDARKPYEAEEYSKSRTSPTLTIPIRERSTSIHVTSREQSEPKQTTIGALQSRDSSEKFLGTPRIILGPVVTLPKIPGPRPKEAKSHVRRLHLAQLSMLAELNQDFKLAKRCREDSSSYVDDATASTDSSARKVKRLRGKSSRVASIDLGSYD